MKRHYHIIGYGFTRGNKPIQEADAYACADFFHGTKTYWRPYPTEDTARGIARNAYKGADAEGVSLEWDIEERAADCEICEQT